MVVDELLTTASTYFPVRERRSPQLPLSDIVCYRRGVGSNISHLGTAMIAFNPWSMLLVRRTARHTALVVSLVVLQPMLQIGLLALELWDSSVLSCLRT